jgi:hypothetical protein
MVFLNPPYRETPKIVLKKIQGKKSWVVGGGGGLGFCKCTGGVRRFFFAGPSLCTTSNKEQGASSASAEGRRRKKEVESDVGKYLHFYFSLLFFFSFMALLCVS